MSRKPGRLSLAWRGLAEVTPQLVDKHKTITELDLSNNNIKSLQPLAGFTNLKVLVLDGNKINEHTKFPRLRHLDTLWVNRNEISNLALFIDKLVEATPDLRHLSMLNNEACPNYFNGGSLSQYRDYRLYVLSRLRTLKMLDDSAVTDDERRKAMEVYGNLDVSVARDKYERMKVQAEQEAKKKERLQRSKALQEKRKQKQMEEEKKRKEFLESLLPCVDGMVMPPRTTPQDNDTDSDWTDSDDDEWSSEDDLRKV